MVKVQFTNGRSGQTETEFLSFSRIRQLIKAVRSTSYAYSRTRTRMGYEAAFIYHCDSRSPSAVLLATVGPDCLVTEILRRNGKTSPLSPREMRGNNYA